VARRSGSTSEKSKAGEELHRFASGKLPGVYSVAGLINPGSVSDQIVRSEFLVQLLLSAKKIGPANRLLIVGGGVAGISAALAALNGGASVTVVEQRRSEIEDDPVSAFFGVQAQCISRRLEPTAYRWPAKGWDVHRFPVDGTDHLLAYERNPAGNIAADWRFRVTGVVVSLRAAGESEQFRQLVDIGILAPNFVSRRQKRLFAELPNGDTHGPFGAIVMAVGAGSEFSTLGQFKSVRFWENDRFDQPGLGCGAHGRDILISGGGDGAIQDALRFLVDPKFRDVEAFVKALAIPEEIAAMVPIAQADDCIGFNLLDAKCQSAAQRYLQDVGDKYVRGVLRRDRPKVHFLYRCNHLQRTYAFNRFALHLLLAVVRGQDRGADPYLAMYDGHDLAVVRCCEHLSGNAAECLGLPHEAQAMRPRMCKVPPHPSATTRLGGDFRVVLLRHGADPSTMHPLAVRKRQTPDPLLPTEARARGDSG
jgi:hypothetical protein